MVGIYAMLIGHLFPNGSSVGLVFEKEMGQKWTVWAVVLRWPKDTLKPPASLLPDYNEKLPPDLERAEYHSEVNFFGVNAKDFWGRFPLLF